MEIILSIDWLIHVTLIWFNLVYVKLGHWTWMAPHGMLKLVIPIHSDMWLGFIKLGDLVVPSFPGDMVVFSLELGYGLPP